MLGSKLRARSAIASGAMLVNDNSEIARRLIELKMEHRDLDDAITRLGAGTGVLVDELQLKRLKKRKLRIKDAIGYLENKLIPDLDA